MILLTEAHMILVLLCTNADMEKNHTDILVNPIIIDWTKTYYYPINAHYTATCKAIANLY